MTHLPDSSGNPVCGAAGNLTRAVDECDCRVCLRLCAAAAAQMAHDAICRLMEVGEDAAN